MHRINKETIIYFLAIFANSCTPQSTTTKFAEDFLYSTPPKERESRMKLYSLDDQYKIYIYGMQEIHPPLRLTRPIAQRGQEAIPFLLSKITSTNNDQDAHDTIYIIEDMKLSKYYDAGKDKKIIRVLYDRILQMKNPFWKKLSLESFNTIQKSK